MRAPRSICQSERTILLVFATTSLLIIFKCFDDMFTIMNITIRDVDEPVFRKFKAESVRKRMKLGNALTNAMMTWLEKEQGKKKVKKHFLDLKPFDWGEGTERSSVEVDEILYAK